MKTIKAFFANIWNWIKSLFGGKPAVAAAPLTGAALAEYFMYKGKHTLVI